MNARSRFAIEEGCVETVTGKMTTSESVGTAKDIEDNVEGSKACPEVTEAPRQSRQLPARHSKVMVKLGLTKALGNFQFARVDIGIEEFSDATPEARAQTFQAITQEVKTQLRAVMQRIAAAQRGTIPDGTPPPEDHLPDELDPETYSMGDGCNG